MYSCQINVFFQGEMVNSIENNIINSSNYVEKAVQDTAAAVVSQKKARKVSNKTKIDAKVHLK